jgi:aminopeptidase N
MSRSWQKRFAAVLLLLCSAFVSFASAAAASKDAHGRHARVRALQLSAQRRERVVEAWRPLHYDVMIAFNDQLTAIDSATTKIQARIVRNGVRAIDLDFGELKIDSVKVDDQPARFERTPERLDVSLAQPAQAGKQLNITVTYHGRPKDGLIFANDRDGKPSATGDNWPDRVHQWIPCLDHPSAKATVSFTVSALPRYLVVANGDFQTMTRNGTAPSVWTFEEGKPIPPYCMVIAVSEGMKLDASEPTVTPLSYYVPRVDGSYARKGFSPAAPALAFFSETIAPYPYEKLALIIGATRFGGMENSSAIVFASTLFDLRKDEPMSAHFGVPLRIEDTVSHEIAHQWFGDTVTESTWADLWLSEGFATYFAALFIEKYDGEETFRSYMDRAAERYFEYERQRRAPVHDTETNDLLQLLNPNNYEKAAWVLHMLRRRLGDEAFFQGLRGYYNAHRDGNATTEDLRGALEKASGQNLGGFFARWIYGKGHPIYQLSWIWKDEGQKGGTLSITLQQSQPDEVFLDPVPVEISTANGKQSLTIQPSEKLTVQKLPLASRPIAVQLDPDKTILKEVLAHPPPP